ncbi:MAG: GGDEF domain-containing protein [Alphaproteobacteria bacterium]|nr:GGDEF domain-containing protein [Alphaproteobacteria bacterium]
MPSASARALLARIKTLEVENRRLRAQAGRDPLTGLHTRRYMKEVAGRMLALHDRDPTHPVALIVCDIDRFKAINDSYGHTAGDTVLKRIGALIRRGIRRSDLAVRMGGEEFAIFVSGPSAPGCAVLAERLRQAASQIRLPGRARGHDITLSFGIAFHRPGESLERMLARADRLLYRAKRGGRDRIETEAIARPVRRR